MTEDGTEGYYLAVGREVIRVTAEGNTVAQRTATVAHARTAADHLNADRYLSEDAEDAALEWWEDILAADRAIGAPRSAART